MWLVLDSQKRIRLLEWRNSEIINDRAAQAIAKMYGLPKPLNEDWEVWDFIGP
jgi:hypothetical protein